MRIRILVTDDHALSREGLVQLPGQVDDLEISGQAVRVAVNSDTTGTQ